jgi:putative ABC transport system ATP-binding protein
MSTSREELINLEGVSKIYDTEELETHALSDINLSIRQGEYVSITGPSGCGKSTLLSVMGLLDSPTEGEYWLSGQPAAKLSSAKRAHLRNRQIGFIFQSFNLINNLSVYENVELPLRFRGMSGAERKERVLDMLACVDMSHRAKHRPSELSGGQQQRVAVARALVGKPLVLLADEPTGNLDSENGEAVMQMLSELHKDGATICMVTHDLRFARQAERTIQLFDGQIVTDGDMIAEAAAITLAREVVL